MLKSFAYTLIAWKLPLIIWIGFVDIALMLIALLIAILNNRGVKCIIVSLHPVVGISILLLSMFIAVCAVSGYWNF